MAGDVEEIMKAVPVQRNNSRAVAAGVIGEWLETGAFPDRLIESVEADRAFVMEVAYGIARWKRALEWFVKRSAKRPPDREIRPFLFVGLYQILLMDRIEEYAAVNETVEAVKSAGFPHAVAFVNVLICEFKAFSLLCLYMQQHRFFNIFYVFQCRD